MQILTEDYMRYFDYSFLEQGMLPVGLVNRVSAISELKEREGARKTGFGGIFIKLESIARVPTKSKALLPVSSVSMRS